MLKVGKYFIAMKGNVDKEINYQKTLEKLNCLQIDLIEFKLPIENSNRALIKIKKIFPTKKIFPRKYNEMKKNPLVWFFLFPRNFPKCIELFSKIL